MIDIVCAYDHLFLRIMICTVSKEQLSLKVQFFNNFMTDKPELTDSKF